jgi:hypothetical protein
MLIHPLHKNFKNLYKISVIVPRLYFDFYLLSRDGHLLLGRARRGLENGIDQFIPVRHARQFFGEESVNFDKVRALEKTPLADFENGQPEDFR